MLFRSTTNSYKRLVPGFEAPVNLALSSRNRSASCRIPMYSDSPKAKRIEVRYPDPSCNPYLTFAAMLMAELAAQLKADGQTLHEKLDALYWQYGCHAEHTISTAMPGAQGMDRMRQLMTRFRTDPPESLAGLAVTGSRDYTSGKFRLADGSVQPFDGPTGDMIILDLEADGNYAAIRPSGTEPKVKFYMFAYAPPAECADLTATNASLAARIAAIEGDLGALAKG